MTGRSPPRDPHNADNGKGRAPTQEAAGRRPHSTSDELRPGPAQCAGRAARERQAVGQGIGSIVRSCARGLPSFQWIGPGVRAWVGAMGRRREQGEKPSRKRIQERGHWPPPCGCALVLALALPLALASTAQAGYGLAGHFGEEGRGRRSVQHRHAALTVNETGAGAGAEAGDVYVLDGSSEQRIQQFHSNGTFVRTWGWGVQDGSDEFQICTVGCHAPVFPSVPGGAGAINFADRNSRRPGDRQRLRGGWEQRHGSTSSAPKGTSRARSASG